MSTNNEEVAEIIAEQLEVSLSEVTEEKSFTEDFMADSLAIVELVLAFEEKFDFKIPDDQVDQIKTVGDAYNYIAKHRRDS
ncbi:MAG: acyl carrier protein [Nannocystaceae bacterium]